MIDGLEIRRMYMYIYVINKDGHSHLSVHNTIRLFN